MNYADLRLDVSRVLRTLAVIEHEVFVENDHACFLMRILPYRTVDNVIDGVVITFIEITERKRHERALGRIAAIVEASQDAIVGHAPDGTITNWNRGAELIFGYTEGEALGKNFSLMIPENRAADVAHILDTVRRGEPVQQFDVEQVRRDGKRIDVSLTISPVWDAEGKLIALSTTAREFTERKQAEQHKNVLMAELDHRVKNILMVISSLVAQSLKATPQPEVFGETIEGRIQALSRVHALLNQRRSNQAPLQDVVEGELAAYRSDGKERVVIDGVSVNLTPRATQSVAMALHELATNAAKYGALSTPDGTVHVSWRIANSTDAPTVTIDWHESGGPRIKSPSRRGFGSDLIERIVSYELEAKVHRDFAPTGLRCRIEFPLRDTSGHTLATAGDGK